MPQLTPAQPQREAEAPLGASYFDLLAIWGALAVYLVLWITFYVPIWQAGSDGPEQKLSPTAPYVASVLGAVLAGFFGNAVGIQRKDPSADSRRLRPGATLVRANAQSPPTRAAFATAAFWVYGAVGAWSLLTVLLYQVQSPQEVKALASAFAGVVLTLFTAALAPGGGRSNWRGFAAPPMSRRLNHLSFVLTLAGCFAELRPSALFCDSRRSDLGGGLAALSQVVSGSVWSLGNMD
jgi:hypothetical protein